MCLVIPSTAWCRLSLAHLTTLHSLHCITNLKMVNRSSSAPEERHLKAALLGASGCLRFQCLLKCTMLDTCREQEGERQAKGPLWVSPGGEGEGGEEEGVSSGSSFIFL